jgi:hypothetical protein
MSDYSKDPCPLENPIASNSITGEKVFLFAFQPIKSGEFSACVMASSEEDARQCVREQLARGAEAIVEDPDGYIITKVNIGNVVWGAPIQ